MLNVLNRCQCDGCQSSIIKNRILCIQCMTDDLSDNIELCSSCIDKTPKKRGFSHDTSHPILKVNEILHDIFLARYVEKALELVSQYRDNRHEESSMRSKSDVPNGYLGAASPLDGPDLACNCCGKYLFPPYWACVLCRELLTFSGNDYSLMICIEYSARELSCLYGMRS